MLTERKLKWLKVGVDSGFLQPQRNTCGFCLCGFNTLAGLISAVFTFASSQLRPGSVIAVRRAILTLQHMAALHFPLVEYDVVPSGRCGMNNIQHNYEVG